MILYLDTSLVVASLTTEANSDDVRNWLGEQRAEDLALSDWVIAEFSAALSMKLRTAQIDVHGRASALSGFTRLYADSLRVLSVSRNAFLIAARFADRHQSGLRAADALHLAICAEQGATLCTLDRRLGESGQALGVPTIQL